MDRESMDLEQLLILASEGDEKAWKLLYPRLDHAVRVIFRRSPGADVEELTQRTLERVTQKLPQFTANKTLLKWVNGIARHQMIDEYEERSRSHAIDKAIAQFVPVPATSPSERYAMNEMVRQFHEELERLPTPYRRAIEHRLAGGDLDSFAQSEGISPITARTRIHRAHEKLRKALQARRETPKRPPTSKPPS